MKTTCGQGLRTQRSMRMHFLLSAPSLLPWSGDSEGIFWSSSQAVTCPPVYHTRWRLQAVPLIVERHGGKL